MKSVEERAGELVISRGDSAVDLQVTNHALDAVALAIHAPVAVDFGLAIGCGRNAGTDAGLMRAGAGDWYFRQMEKQPNEVRTI
jgi:hypothetical protein